MWKHLVMEFCSLDETEKIGELLIASKGYKQ